MSKPTKKPRTPLQEAGLSADISRVLHKQAVEARNLRGIVIPKAAEVAASIGANRSMKRANREFNTALDDRFTQATKKKD